MKEQKFDFYSSKILKTYDLEPEIRNQLKVLDSLDPFTRKHCENVGDLTARICQELNLDEGFTNYAAICGYLHDIGKLFIPPSVLQKQGPLTKEEYEIMKTHTTIGYNICHANPKLRGFEQGPITHHEALDGTGYPKGLIGHEIMYEGQIIRVADEFDAISSKRQYKDHIGTLDTLRILIENTKPTEKSKPFSIRGKRVGRNNPEIVNALIRVIRRDVEYEIYQREIHIDYIKNEIKRYKDALKKYEKAMKQKREDKKDYFLQYAQGYLVTGEKVDDAPIYYKEAITTLEEKEAELKDLIKDYKQIKKLKA